MGGAVLGVVVVVVIIVAALAGYFAASASISASTSTSYITTTLPAVTNTVTSTSIATATSTVTNTATVAVTNTISVTGTVTSTITGSPTTITSTSTVTSTSTSTSISTSVTTSTQTAAACPTLPSFGSSSLPTPPSAISEAGSSLLYPLFELWQANFTKDYSNVPINTAAGGSGSGQSGVEAGTLNLGGSDVFATAAQIQAYPNILNIPVAISAQQVNYNVPGLPQPLNFNGNVLSGIYNGTIQYWDNAAIKAINPADASTLPHQLIVPIHRSDSSGDTALFTTYLTDTSPSWAKNVGEGTTVSWPSNPAATAASGNSGMLTADEQTEYSIAYIGISYEIGPNGATAAGLGTGLLLNLAGNYVAETAANIEAAVNAQYTSTPANERASLIYGPGANSYPDVNYEYVWVQQNQPSVALQTDIQAIFSWVTSPTYGNSAYFLNQVGFQPLPASILSLTCAQVDSITG